MYRIIISLFCFLIIQYYFVIPEYAFGEDNSSVRERLAKPNPFLKTEHKKEKNNYISEADIVYTIDEEDKDSGGDVTQKTDTGKKRRKMC